MSEPTADALSAPQPTEEPGRAGLPGLGEKPTIAEVAAWLRRAAEERRREADTPTGASAGTAGGAEGPADGDDETGAATSPADRAGAADVDDRATTDAGEVPGATVADDAPGAAAEESADDADGADRAEESGGADEPDGATAAPEAAVEGAPPAPAISPWAPFTTEEPQPAAPPVDDRAEDRQASRTDEDEPAPPVFDLDQLAGELASAPTPVVEVEVEAEPEPTPEPEPEARAGGPDEDGETLVPKAGLFTLPDEPPPAALALGVPAITLPPEPEPEVAPEVAPAVEVEDAPVAFDHEAEGDLAVLDKASADAEGETDEIDGEAEAVAEAKAARTPKRRRPPRVRYPRGQLKERVGFLRRLRAIVGVAVIAVLLGIGLAGLIGGIAIFLFLAGRSAINS